MANEKRGKKLSLLVCVGMLCIALVGGTFAYLTDRDATANVFTQGNVDITLNEDFVQGADLLPGQKVEKNVTVTNNDRTNAYVWVDIAVPAALDNANDASQNALHFNYTEESAADGEWVWTDSEGGWLLEKDVDIEGELYNVYTVLYQTPLESGQTTATSAMSQVYLDPHVDVAPDGSLNWVQDGAINQIGWNVDEQVLMYVSAYAIQAEGFESVQDAYAAYQTQWGDKGKEWGETPTSVSDTEELDEAIEGGATTLLLSDGVYVLPDSAKGKELTIIGNGDSIIATDADTGSYEGCNYALDGSTATFENVVFNTDGKDFTGYARCDATYNNCVINNTYSLYGDSVFNNCEFNVSGDHYNIWTWGAPTAVFNNCEFNSDGKAMLLYGTVNTKLTMNDCVFNDKGGLVSPGKAAIEIGNDYSKSYELIVNNATVNGYDEGKNTGSTLWANKNSMSKDNLNVVVDGVDVY